MALFHFSVKAISRSAGRSATAAAAYRAGERILDERTGEIHDYTRKRGVESADLVLPDGAPEWASDRAKLWNAAELAEKRKDACVAREFEVALPAELSPASRRSLALDFARDMANREGCAVDVAIHAPGKGGDNRNYHAHMLRTTRKVETEGLGAKLDTEKAGRKRADDLEAVRARWAELTNMHLERAGVAERVDHRSLKAQGIEHQPTRHLGPAATGYERRTGEPSDNRIRQEQQAAERAAHAELGALQRQEKATERSISVASAELKAAKHEQAKRDQAERLKAAYDQAQRDQAKQAQAERQRIERMSAAELRVEIERQRPLSVRDMVELQPEVIDARHHSQHMAREAAQKRAEAVQALHEAQDWRSAHPLRAKVHDAGLLRSKVLLKIETRHQEAQADWEKLEPRVLAAEIHVERVRDNTQHRVAQEHAPALAKVVELERMEREKRAKEQAERAKVQETDKALSAFKTHALKREMKAHSYGDTGKQWNAIPEPLRKKIEDFNRLPKEARPVALEQIHQRMKREPQALKNLTQQLHQVKEIDRGMSR